MVSRKLSPSVYSVGAVDWDRRLFDELIPLPDGTSYNSYLIRGRDRTALIDTVDPTKQAELSANLAAFDVSIDYVVCNHAEQDHSGALPAVLELYPQAKVVANAKCLDMLKDLLHVDDDRLVEIKDRETLSLGGKTLEFIFTPWVHWPETMLTYLREDKILFTCDFFGSHYAASDLPVMDEGAIYEAAKRYYAEIMMPYRRHIIKHLDKVAELDVDIIAPSHGPVYPTPAFITEAYRDWAGDAVKNEVVLVHTSMHGSTARMVDHLIGALIERGITVKPFNLSRTDLGALAISLVDAATVVLASPAVLGGAHPNVVYAASLANALKPKTRFASIIGSYGWGSRMVEQLTGLISNLKVELIEPVLVKGNPTPEDLSLIDALAETIDQRHKEAAVSLS